MPEFTKGPWILGDENNQHAQVCLGESNCSVDLRRFPDYPNCEGMSRDEMLANAHLIAAAPELYWALKWLVKEANERDQIYSECYDMVYKSGFLPQAEDVLAKAVGNGADEVTKSTEQIRTAYPLSDDPLRGHFEAWYRKAFDWPSWPEIRRNSMAKNEADHIQQRLLGLRPGEYQSLDVQAAWVGYVAGYNDARQAPETEVPCHA